MAIDDDVVTRLADIAVDIAMAAFMRELPAIQAEIMSTLRKELSSTVRTRDVGKTTAEIIKGNR
jgi:hypothetical protein